MLTVAVTFLKILARTGTLFSLQLSKLFLVCPTSGTERKGYEMLCRDSTNHWNQRVKLYFWTKSNHRKKIQSSFINYSPSSEGRWTLRKEESCIFYISSSKPWRQKQTRCAGGAVAFCLPQPGASCILHAVSPNKRLEKLDRKYKWTFM